MHLKATEVEAGHVSGRGGGTAKKTLDGESALPTPAKPLLNRSAVLHIIDDRTGDYYSIPITHNAINASDFKRIRSPENVEYPPDQNEQGLRIFDPGFSNTTVSESAVTFMYEIFIPNMM